QGGFCRYRPGLAAGLLDQLAWAVQRARTNARCPDCPPCLRGVVGLSHGPHHEQHSRLRVLTFAPAFRRFAFVYSMAFALLYVVARAWGLALFTFYPAQGILLWGMRRSRDVADPAMDFLAPEMWWYGWTASAAIGALVIGLVAALLPDSWCRRFWAG